MFERLYNRLPNIIKHHISWQFIKFLFVGVLNTFFGYGVFAFFNFIGLHYSLSTLLATILGILFNFKTTGCIVFKNNSNKLIFRFLAVYGFVYFLTIFILSIFIKIGLQNMYINYAIILPFNAVISYLLMKKIVFNKKDKLCKI